MTIAVREYTDASKMLADYAARRARMYGGQPKPVEIEVKPEPSAVAAEFNEAVKACSGSVWTRQEDAALKRLAAKGMTAFQISQHIPRSRQAVVARAKLLKVIVGNPKPPKAVKPKEEAFQDAIKLYRLVLDTSTSSIGRARQIMKVVAEDAGFTVADLISERRHNALTEVRAKAMWLIAREMPMTYPAIGRLFGGRDHTTVLNAIRRHNGRTGQNVRGAGQL